MLCAGRKDTVVRYALAGTNQPVAVADYTYDALPADVRGALPTEAELDDPALNARRALEEDQSRRSVTLSP